MRRLLTVSFLTMFVIGTDTFVVSPLLPTLEARFHVQDAFAPWLVGAYALGYAVFALIAGPVSDRLDKKRVMQVGLVAFTLSTLLCGLAEGFWSMIVLRGIAGISAAFTAPQVWAGIAALLPRDKVVRGMGIATAGLAMSQVLGVPLGSFLSSYSWRIPFYFVAVMSLFTILLVSLWIPHQPPVTRGSTRVGLLRPYKALFQARVAIFAFGAYFLFQFGNFGRFSVIGIWMHEKFGFTTSQLGYVMIAFGIGNLLGSLFGNRIIERLGETRSLLFGLPVVALISVLLPTFQSPISVEASWAVTSMTFGIMFPVMMSILQSFANGARSTVAGFSNSLMYGGTTLGSMLCGELYARLDGFLAVSLFSAVCFALAWSGFYLVHRGQSQVSCHEALRTKGA